MINADIIDCDLKPLIADADVIFHLAATPGVRTSWGSGFFDYVRNNIWATQNLLEALKDSHVKKVILASTSSVYGNFSGPASEENFPKPLSPYGVTKLAAEHISNVYQREFNVPLTVLRFFTVYGPRQRPDMAFHRFIKSVLTDSALQIFGDGNQKRDFTHVYDIINACINAMGLPQHGNVFNVGGDRRVSVNEVLQMIEKLTGCRAKLTYLKPLPGEPRETWADITRAETHLNYRPQTKLEDGLREEIDYIRELYHLY